MRLNNNAIPLDSNLISLFNLILSVYTLDCILLVITYYIISHNTLVIGFVLPQRCSAILVISETNLGPSVDS